MNGGPEPFGVLITSAPTEAGGGIAALHQTLFRDPGPLTYRPVLFPVSSPRQFDERWARRISRVITRMVQLVSALRKDRSIRIVHINTSYDSKAIVRDSMFLLAARFLRRKAVLQIHSAVVSDSVPGAVEWLARTCFPLSDRILVFSQEDRKSIMTFVPGENIVLFPNAVNVGEFRLKDRSLKQELGIPEDGKIVLFLSRLIRGKGGYDLIESIPAVAEKCGNAYFLFVGDGPEREGMKAACRETGIEYRVRFPGRLEDRNLIRAFSCSDLFVLPAIHQEGMPMAILEALAAGLPIVSTPKGAIPEIIRDGINGFLVAPRNPGQIAEKIVLILQQEEMKRRMGTENVRLAEARFDVGPVQGKMEDLYASLLPRSRS